MKISQRKPSYLDSSNAMIPLQMTGKKKIPIPKPVPLPNAFASLIAVITEMTISTIGTRSRRLTKPLPHVSS